MTKRNAVALQDITHADDIYLKGQTILGMPAGRFADWSGVDLVREATEAEVNKARGKPATDAPAVKPKARAKKTPAKAAAPAPTPPPVPDAALAAG